MTEPASTIKILMVEDVPLDAELTLREGVLVLRVAPDGLTPAERAAAVDRVAERVADVPGIVRVCRALRVDKTPDAAIAASLALTDPASGRITTSSAAVPNSCDPPASSRSTRKRSACGCVRAMSSRTRPVPSVEASSTTST